MPIGVFYWYAYIQRMEYIGEAAGLATAFFWALTSIFFAEAGKLIGSFRVNVIRLLIAVAIYTALLLITTGRILPADINQSQLFWLTLSGLIGLILGDGCGFKALVMIGPRLTSLLYASAPIMATIIAWMFLGEKLGVWSLVGIGLTVAGITWVVMERGSRSNNTNSIDHPDAGSLAKGVLLGLGAAAGQAIGLVMAKHAMVHCGGEIEPLQASFVRMSTSMVAIWMLVALRGHLGSTLTALRQIRPMLFCTGGAVVGPFLGVWMSLVAVRYIATGTAATLNAMTPVVIIPLIILYYKEKVSLRAFLGAVVAVGGVAILIMS
ncbi:MAG: DMT family transporter [candidate division Zixibacteria bacterium]|nr:DMT family transporter [candidate division Zixibacteria bacterium]MDH4034792.1 DMT family transporter [candidate division Zixibacteria bacterium]